MLAAMAQRRRAMITWQTTSGELAHHHALVQATFNTVSGPQNRSMYAITQLGSAPMRGMVQDNIAGFVFISQESPIEEPDENAARWRHSQSAGGR